jgi:hypothetical protein
MQQASDRSLRELQRETEQTRAGLTQNRQDGRFVFYSANFQNMNALVGYLTENCCGGRSCAPIAAKATLKGKSHETLPRARRRA